MSITTLRRRHCRSVLVQGKIALILDDDRSADVSELHRTEKNRAKRSCCTETFLCGLCRVAEVETRKQKCKKEQLSGQSKHDASRVEIKFNPICEQSWRVHILAPFLFIPSQTLKFFLRRALTHSKKDSRFIFCFTLYWHTLVKPFSVESDRI